MQPEKLARRDLYARATPTKNKTTKQISVKGMMTSNSQHMSDKSEISRWKYASNSESIYLKCNDDSTFAFFSDLKHTENATHNRKLSRLKHFTIIAYYEMSRHRR